MAEVLTSFSTKSLPVFSSNQILKADDLNALSEYMDGQNRLTRLLTIGSGIVSGLTASCINIGGVNIIQVMAGFGISSDGYLFRLTQDCDFDLIRPKSSFPNDTFPCGLGQGSCYTEPWDISGVDAWEIEASGNEDGGGFLSLDDFANRMATTLEVFLQNKVLLFVRCQTDEERSPCFNECDQTGIDRNIKVRKYLLEKDDIKNFIRSEGDDQEIDVLGDLCPPPFMNRFGFIPDKEKYVISEIRNYTQYQNNYLAITQSAFQPIKDAYEWASTVMSGQPGLEPNSFSDLKARLQNLASQFNANPNQIKGIQYFYDYLKDLILAYREFERAFCEVILSGSFLPDQCNHPGFIALGGISKTGSPDPNLDCRTGFLASQLGNVSVAELLRKPIFYFNRMVKLSKPEIQSYIASLSNEINEEPTEKTIRITGDRGLNFDLSERGIPYYYEFNKDFRDCWNHCYSGRNYHLDGITFGSARNIPSYYNEDNNLGKPFHQHLNYDLHHHDFFRIEGHVGGNLEAAVAQIENLRKCLNLPFDIKKTLILNDGVDIQNQEEILNPKYLQLVYENIRCDIISAIINNNPEPPDFNLPDTLEEFCDSRTDLIPLIQNGINILDEQNPPNVTNPEEAACYIDLLNNLCDKLQNDEPICYFHDYAKLHCGLEHVAGVTKGGTFVLVYTMIQGEERVIGDFYLPYFCCGEEQIINMNNVLPEPELLPFVYISPCDFCVTDPRSYPILTYPKGGTVTACLPDGVTEIDNAIDPDGKFLPSAVMIPAAEEKQQVIIKFTPQTGDPEDQTVIVWREPGLEFEEGDRQFILSNWFINFFIAPPFTYEYKVTLFKMISDGEESTELQPIEESLWVSVDSDTNELGYTLPSGKYRLQITARNKACSTTKHIDFQLGEDDPGFTEDSETESEEEMLPTSRMPSTAKARASKKTSNKKEQKKEVPKKEATKKKPIKKAEPSEDLMKKEGAAKLIRRRAATFASVEKMMSTGNLKNEMLEEYVKPTFKIAYSEFEKLEEHFETAKDFLVKEIKTKVKSPAIQKKYFDLLASMTHYYMDSLVLKSPAKVNANGKKLLSTLVKQLKDLKMETQVIGESWKAIELKEQLNAKAVDNYLKIFN